MNTTQKLWKPILVGAVLFAVLSAAGQTFFVGSAMDSMPDSLGGMDMDYMEELAQRIEAGDEEAMKEMMDSMGVMGADGMFNEEIAEEVATDMALEMFGGMLPGLSTFILVMMVVSLLANAYYLVIAVHGEANTKSALQKTPGLILPLLGLWIWTFLRTFAWIPIIGLVFAIIIGPRLIAAQVILLREGKGVIESTKLSYERTRGYWGKIFGNLLVMALLLWVVLLVAGIALSIALAIFASSSMLLSSLTVGIMQWLATAYGTIFAVKLADTVMANRLQ